MLLQYTNNTFEQLQCIVVGPYPRKAKFIFSQALICNLHYSAR